MNAIYARVSTDEQAQHGYSLNDQIASCRSRLTTMGLCNIKEYIDDGYSGEYLERPALEQLRADLRTGLIKNICVYDPDRLSRNLVNQLLIADDIEKTGVHLYFVTGDYDCSPEGRLFFSIRGAISAFEKAKIRERTSRGRKAKAKSGKIVLNARPYGYNFDKEISMYVINQEEAKIVKQIYDMCINQGMGSRTIANELARQGVPGRKSRYLSIMTVEKVLTRDLYYGQHYLFRQSVRKTGQNSREIKNLPREEWIPITVPAIVDKETWNKAQIQRKKNKKYAKRRCTREYLLKGIIKCTLCGRNMIGVSRPATGKGNKNKFYSYYVCISKESGTYNTVSKQICHCRRVPVEVLDTTVWDTIKTILCNQASLDAFFKTNIIVDCSKEVDQLTAKKKMILDQRTKITKWYRENLINSKDAEQELSKMANELHKITSSLHFFENIYHTASNSTNKLSLEQFLETSTFDKKQKILLSSNLKIHALRNCDSDEIHWKFIFQPT